jgi:hypothetical protein
MFWEALLPILQAALAKQLHPAFQVFHLTSGQRFRHCWWRPVQMGLLRYLLCSGPL